VIEKSRTEAAEALRVLVRAIILTPQGETPGIELRGDLAAMRGRAKATPRGRSGGAVVAVRKKFKSRPRNQNEKGGH
jgi:hypothetical protein